MGHASSPALPDTRPACEAVQEQSPAAACMITMRCSSSTAYTLDFVEDTPGLYCALSGTWQWRSFSTANLTACTLAGEGSAPPRPAAVSVGPQGEQRIAEELAVGLRVQGDSASDLDRRREVLLPSLLLVCVLSTKPTA